MRRCSFWLKTIAFAPARKQQRYGLARVLLPLGSAFRLPKSYSYAMASRGFVVAIYALPLTRLGVESETQIALSSFRTLRAPDLSRHCTDVRRSLLMLDLLEVGCFGMFHPTQMLLTCPTSPDVAIMQYVKSQFSNVPFMLWCCVGLGCAASQLLRLL